MCIASPHNALRDLCGADDENMSPAKDKKPELGPAQRAAPAWIMADRTGQGRLVDPVWPPGDLLHLSPGF